MKDFTYSDHRFLAASELVYGEPGYAFVRRRHGEQQIS
jgi:hypothetical protein